MKADNKPALRLLRALLRAELWQEKHGFSADDELIKKLRNAIRKLEGK